MKFEIIKEGEDSKPKEQPVKIYLCESGDRVDVVFSHPNHHTDLHVVRFYSDGTMSINDKIEDRLKKIGFITENGGVKIVKMFDPFK